MPNIVIVGYPKSGSTWATRLVAQLVDCPSAGHWQASHTEMATEGLDRVSPHLCWKSHRSHDTLGVDAAAGDRVIYVVRDPRDVVISGANYFYFDRWPVFGRTIDRIPKGRGVYNRLLYSRVTPYELRLDRMVDAVTEGNSVHEFTALSWVEHLTPYRESGALVVRYEDLLAEPHGQSERILAYLEIERQAQAIDEAVHQQSFEVRKQEFEESGNATNADFLRSGKSEQWRGVLTEQQLGRIDRALGPTLTELGYPTDY